jgi:hypothetical protein
MLPFVLGAFYIFWHGVISITANFEILKLSSHNLHCHEPCVAFSLLQCKLE